MASNSSIVTPENKIRNLQRTLYRQAKKNPKWKAWSLYGDLCRQDILNVALKQVLANKGAPGIDGMRVETLKEDAEVRKQFLEDLQQLLKGKTFNPDPVRRVYIPKPNGSKRALGIPTVRDRVVQTALKILLEPIFEAYFHPNSFAYRPRKGAHEAIAAIEIGLIKSQREVIDADLSKYFDTIPHSALLKQISKRVSDGAILKLVKAFLRAPIVESQSLSGKNRTLPNRKGTPQGGVISPLLANLYLNDLDYAVNEECELNPTMVRYADDLLILCRTGQGKALKERLSRYLKRKGLELNEEKTRIVDSTKECFTFLGFRFKWRNNWKTGKMYPHKEPSPEARKSLRNKVRSILNHWTCGRHTEDVVDEVNTVVRGWTEYFHYGNTSGVFFSMQEWLDKRLNKWLWRKHDRKYSLWKDYNGIKLRNKYGLYSLPTRNNYSKAKR